MTIFWDRNSGYGIMLDKYNDNYSLVAGRKSEKDGAQYKDWCFLSKWENGGPVPDDKKRPMGVYFGDRQKAIEALEFFLKALKGSPTAGPEPADSEIPF